jgi:hypothetical protein
MTGRNSRKSDGMSRRAAIVSLAVALILAAAGAVALFATGGEAPTAAAPWPQEQSPGEVVVYLASEEFARLPLDERREYLAATGEAKELWSGEDGEAAMAALSSAQRQRLRRNIGEVYESGWRRELNRYFELSAEERVAYLDEMIDKAQAKATARKEAGGETQSTAKTKGKSDSGFGPEDFHSYIVKTDPARRAREMEFKRAYIERMRERGIASTKD